MCIRDRHLTVCAFQQDEFSNRGSCVRGLTREKPTVLWGPALDCDAWLRFVFCSECSEFHGPSLVTEGYSCRSWTSSENFRNPLRTGAQWFFRTTGPCFPLRGSSNFAERHVHFPSGYGASAHCGALSVFFVIEGMLHRNFLRMLRYFAQRSATCIFPGVIAM